MPLWMTFFSASVFCFLWIMFTGKQTLPNSSCGQGHVLVSPVVGPVCGGNVGFFYLHRRSYGYGCQRQLQRLRNTVMRDSMPPLLLEFFAFVFVLSHLYRCDLLLQLVQAIYGEHFQYFLSVE